MQNRISLIPSSQPTVSLEFKVGSRFPLISYPHTSPTEVSPGPHLCISLLPNYSRYFRKHITHIAPLTPLTIIIAIRHFTSPIADQSRTPFFELTSLQVLSAPSEPIATTLFFSLDRRNNL